jgi:hypothetical protein
MGIDDSDQRKKVRKKRARSARTAGNARDPDHT